MSPTPWWFLAGLPLAACLSSGDEGRREDVAVDSDDVAVDSDDVAVDSDDIAVDSDDVAVDSDVAVDTVDTHVGRCPADDEQFPEPCDDGNDCAGDGCHDCARERSVVVTELALEANAGFDLDDKDGDGDRATGLDNRIGASSVVAGALNGFIADLITRGEVLQLATFGSDGRLALHPGHFACDGAVPAGWSDGTSARLFATPFPECAAPVSIPIARDGDHVRAGPNDITLALGSLGTFPISRSYLDAALETVVADPVHAPDRITRLDGVIGGVLPAAALYRIDTSAFLPRCPTALHAVLGLAGHLDQDGDGDGAIDFVRWSTTANTTPCVTGPVVIDGCCVDGLCDDEHLVRGRDCALDPRVTDGYSVGFAVHAVEATIEGLEVCAP